MPRAARGECPARRSANARRGAPANDASAADARCGRGRRDGCYVRQSGACSAANCRQERPLDSATVLRDVALIGIAYLSGSVPVGVLVARLSGEPDPRTVGSGRTGGTNALRALGRKWAAVVVIGDLAKGALPVLLARFVTGGSLTTAGDPLVEVACGLAAVVGSARSIFIGFRGGRGVGTGVGTMLVIEPVAVLLATPVFIG